MSRRALILVVSLVSILAVVTVYFGFYGKENKKINTKTEAATSSKTLTTEAEWDAGTKVDVTTTGDRVQINNATATLNLPLLYQQDPSRLTSNLPNPERAIDGNTSTFYGYYRDPHPEDVVWTMDLGAVYKINQFSDYLDVIMGSSFHYVSLDGVNFGNSITPPACVSSPPWQVYDFAPVSARYIRFVGREGYLEEVPNHACDLSCNAALYETKVSGSAVATHTSAATQLDGTANIKNWTTFVPTDTIPASTSVNFRFRTSDDHATWGSWTGSTASSASINIGTLLGAGDTAKRYLQVETTLANTDGASTPTLDAYTANYETAVLDHLVVTPASATVQVNGTQAISAVAYDDSSAVMPDATFSWSTTCGSVGAAGATVTFTAPAAVPVGNTCTVTASSTVDGVTKTADSVITVTASPPPPLVCNNNGSQDNGETGVDCGGGGCGDCIVEPPKPPTCPAGGEGACSQQAEAAASDCILAGSADFTHVADCLARAACGENTCILACGGTGADSGALTTKVLEANGGESYQVNTTMPIRWIYGAGQEPNVKWPDFSKGEKTYESSTPIAVGLSTDGGLNYNKLLAVLYPQSLTDLVGEPNNQYAQMAANNFGGVKPYTAYRTYSSSLPVSGYYQLNLTLPNSNSIASNTARIKLIPLQVGSCTPPIDSDFSDNNFRIVAGPIVTTDNCALSITPTTVGLLPLHGVGSDVSSKQAFTVVAKNKDGDVLTGKVYSWSTTGGTIVDNGGTAEYTADIGYGNYQVKATAPWCTEATAEVNVGSIYCMGGNCDPANVITVSITPTNPSIHTGDNQEFTAKVTDKGGNDVTGQSTLNYFISAGGKIVSSSNNHFTVKAGDSQGSFKDVISVEASRNGLTARAQTSLIVNNSWCVGDTCFCVKGDCPPCPEVTCFLGICEYHQGKMCPICIGPNCPCTGPDCVCNAQIEPDFCYCTGPDCSCTDPEVCPKPCVGDSCPCTGPDCKCLANNDVCWCAGPDCACTDPNKCAACTNPKGCPPPCIGDDCKCVGDKCACIGPDCNCQNPDKCQTCVGDNCDPKPCIGDSCLPCTGILCHVFPPGPIVGPICIGSFCEQTPPGWPINPLVLIPLLATLLLAIANPENLAIIVNALSRFYGLFAKGKDQKHAPGVVYDGATGLAIGGVIVMLFRARDKKLISTVKSDKNGKFALETPPGEEYYIEIEKVGYDLVKNQGLQSADLAYGQNYFAKNIFRPAETERLFDKALPLATNNDALADTKKSKLLESISKILRILNVPIILFGLVMSVISYYRSHFIINIIVLYLYGALIVYYLVKYLILSGRGFGKVYDINNGQGIELATINLISESDGKLKATSVSDAKGRFLVAIPKGFYKILISKPGYSTHMHHAVRIKSALTPARVIIGMDEAKVVDRSITEPALAPLPTTSRREIVDSADIIERYNQKRSKFGTADISNVGIHHLINQKPNLAPPAESQDRLRVPTDDESPKPEKPNWQIPGSHTPL
ncbi:MAG: hypothetical protein WCP91_01385 [Candidatus Berkelbacteria bacterium]